MLTRRLALKKETLAPLATDELRLVAAAAASINTCVECIKEIVIPSLFDTPTNCCAGIPTFHRCAL